MNMNKNTQNTPSELLTRLLDGELEYGQEQLLYDKLAQDPELQAEMNDMIAIRETVRRDTDAFTPPAELTNSVFSTLGFVAPMNQYPAPKRRYLLRYSVLALLFLAVSTFIAYQSDFIFGSKIPVVSSIQTEDGETRNTSKTNDAVTRSESSDLAVSNNSVSKNNALTTEDRNASSSLINIPSEQKPIAEEAPESESATTVQSNTNKDLIAFAETNQDGIIYNQLIDQSNSIIIDNPIGRHINDKQKAFSNSFDFARAISNIDSRNMQNTYSSGKREKTLNLRGVYAISNDENKLQSSIIESFTIAAFISSGFVENLSIGAEFGREPYNQIFVKQQSAGYVQDPSIVWLGIGAKYDFTEVSIYGITPFAQLVAGGSELGPIGRAFLGMSKTYSNGIGFNFGIESSLMLYKNQNKYYTSDKVSLSGGVLYRF